MSRDVVPDMLSRSGTFGAQRINVATDDPRDSAVGVTTFLTKPLLEVVWVSKDGELVELLIESSVSRKYHYSDMKPFRSEYVKGAEFEAVEQYNDELADFLPDHVFKQIDPYMRAYRMDLL